VLEPRVMQVLVALARERGEIVSRDDLIASCWAGRIVGEDAINRCTFRSDPRFWRAAARAGYLDYWRKRGVWPDFCYDPKLPFDCRRAAVAATG
ncbi:hypothetical protein, partial [Phenylobacterium sp.]|uniref:winged helix-turn-helix domain-containing protein n=1 Tax=Phenylobacterium sp. TaxID=1871053 RepID=UPI0026324326